MLLTSSRLLLCLCALYAALGAFPAAATTIVSAKKIDLPGASLQDVRVQLDPGATPDTLKLILHAIKADVPAAGWHHVGLTLNGNLRRDAQLRWLFDGTVGTAGAPGGALANAGLQVIVDAAANTLQIDSIQGAMHISTAFPLDQPSHAQIDAKNVPAEWLQGLLATVWAGRISGGKVDAKIALDVREQGIQTSGDFSADGLRYLTPAGAVAGQQLGARGRFAIDGTAVPAQVQVNGNLHGGQLLLGPMLANFPDHDVAVDVDAELQHGTLGIRHFRLDDADALHIDGALAIDAKGNLQKLKLDHVQARFPASAERYGQPWLDNLLGPGVRINGQIDGHIDLAADGVHGFTAHSEALDLSDANGRFQWSGVRGTIDWSAQGDRPATAIAWDQLLLRHIAAGAAQSHWRSHNGVLALQSPLDMPVLHGQVMVNTLDWHPVTTSGQHLNLSMSLNSLDLAALNEAVGWTPIVGSVSGALSSTRRIGDSYPLDGELTVNAFGGSATASHLSVQRLLGDTPLVNGDLTLHQLDLTALTTAFDFGAISGHLNGAIGGLQLAGGNPVAFKATLLADGGGKISQRAANNLSAISGASATGGLQGAMLHLLKSTGYKRIGLNATLQDGVAHLSGLQSDADGYTIVEGSGLPYLHLVGPQTQVEWPVLQHRLKAATQGSQGVVSER